MNTESSYSCRVGWASTREKRDTIGNGREETAWWHNIFVVIMQVVHNYGHGGSGVGLSWGCAESVAELATAALQGHRSQSKL